MHVGIIPANAQQSTTETGPAVEALTTQNREMLARCFDIRQLELDGFSAFSASELARIQDRYLPRCLNALQIREIQMHLQGEYVARGMPMARVLTPDQNLSGGILKFVAIEGVLERVDASQLAGNGARRASAALPNAIGEPVRINQIDLAAAQLSRTPSAQVKAQLYPGTQPGTSVLVLSEVAQSPWRAAIGIDNYGSKETGTIRARLEVERDNLFSLNDTWLITAIPSEKSTAYALSSSAGIGSWVIGADESRSQYALDLRPGIRTSGKTQSTGIKSDYIVRRTAMQEVKLMLSIARKRSTRELEGVQLLPQVLAPIKLGVDYTIRREGQVFRMELAASRGTKAFGTRSDMPGLPAEFPRAQFSKYEMGLQMSKQSELWSFSSQIRVQYSPAALFPSEQLIAASVYSARGFNEGALAGDKGFFVRNELALTTVFNLGLQDVESKPYLILDGAGAKSVNGRWLSGVSGGLGIRGQRGHLKWNIAATRPVAAHEIEKTTGRLNAELTWELL